MSDEGQISLGGYGLDETRPDQTAPDFVGDWGLRPNHRRSLVWRQVGDFSETQHGQMCHVKDSI